jgi:hypothetical protein
VEVSVGYGSPSGEVKPHGVLEPRYPSMGGMTSADVRRFHTLLVPAWDASGPGGVSAETSCEAAHKPTRCGRLSSAANIIT